MQGITKARFWVGVLYTENMKENWSVDIGDIVQVPYAYCVHDKDLDDKNEQRKEHVHLMLAFSNTTTYRHALTVFSLLSADETQAINTCQACVNVRSMYDYLIHDTETCRKKGKFLYAVSERIVGNNFDIGSYEQLGLADKKRMLKELAQFIIDNNVMNFTEFYESVLLGFPDDYLEIIASYSGLLERLTKGNYQKYYNDGKNGKN